jgi:ribosomal protein RSM22 (predicted rRNA methylase)
MPALGLALVQPLEPDWQATLDRVAKRRAWPTSRDVVRLAAELAHLSDAYNDPARARAAMRDAGAARLGFAFARDVPKAGAAVRELVATRQLKIDATRPLRVLDLGAGLGAASWGVVRALEAAGMRGAVEAEWVDADPEALELAMEVVREREGRGTVRLSVRTTQASVERLEPRAHFDLVLASHLLSELDVGLPQETRLQRHAALLASLLRQRVGEAGSLVLIEPALRDRTRHLHRVRDALATLADVAIFAPCLHRQRCPALERETDWCHEDLPIDLPSWLAPVARTAGLRRQGLTFSYLVLRRDNRSIGDGLVVPAGSARLRVVSDAMPTKGKREAFVCGELDHAGARVAGRVRLMRLDRDANERNASWDEVRRGDLLAIRPAPDFERPRIGPSFEVTAAVAPDGEESIAR